jgi:hypothetical protein
MGVFAGAAVTAAVATSVMAWSPWSASAGGPIGYEPVLRAIEFSTRITNPYFPMPVGRKLVYRGVKDGKPQRDVVTVTHRTRLVAEKTADWYAQDKRGNVWYLGERTAAYANGEVDTSGSWEAGVNDAEPGVVMKAHPYIPCAYRQEFLRGEAEDTAWVVRTGGTVTVPYGTLHHILVTLEATRIEAGLYDKKIYAAGIGIVSETALTGQRETARLVRVIR